MAQENRNPNQQQNQGGQRPAVADPYSDPVAYLRSKGWKCLGDPNWERALWLDPTKPLKDEYKLVPRFGWVKTTIPGKFEANGQPLVEPRWVQLQAQDGSGIPGKTVPIEQWLITPKVEPMILQAALMIQLDRDFAAQEAATKQAG